MSGHVLIIDALSNRRIHLRAQLDTAAYAVDLADTLQDGLMRLQHDPPDVVIFADDLPGLRLRQVCKALRANACTQLTTIVVAVARENHSARISALSAGAHDVIDHHSDASDLRARLRNFMRIRQTTEDTQRQKQGLATGLAEARQDFTPKTIASVIATGGTQDMTTRIAAMPEDSGVRANVVTALSARRTPDPEADVFVIVESGSGPDARDLLCALLTHPDSRHARFLFVSDRGAPAASPLDLGADDHVPHSVTPAELAVRISRLARRKQDSDRARKAARQLNELAYTDPTTKLNNRQAMDAYLTRLDRALAEHPRPLALLIADIDHFKAINDNHGHAAGDDILAHVATLLKSNLRDGDFIARYGGEEFLIVLHDVGPGQARSIAQRLGNRVAASPKRIEDGPHVRATISIGLAHAGRTDRLSTRALMRAADNALYLAKGNGRNRIEVAGQQDFERLPARAVDAVTQGMT